MKLGITLMLIFLCSQAVFAQSGGPTADAEATTPVNTVYLWRQAVGGKVLGRPTVQAQSVVVVLDGGNIKAYSASGRPLWNFSALGRLSPYVTRSREGTSYICRTNGIFIAVNRSGRELWRINIGGPLAGPVVSGWDGRVFIPTAKKIACYTASGNPLWTRELEAALSAGPWLDQNGGIMLALENGDAMRINPYGEAVSRRLPSPPRILLSLGPSVSSNNASTIPLILALHRSGDVQLIDLNFPNTAPISFSRLPSAPLAAAGRGGNAAIALANGQALMLSGADGKVLWTADTRVRVQQGRGGEADNDATVIYDERGVYVLTAGGAAGFSAGGRRLWFTILSSASGLPAFDDEGVLYSGGADWILYAWKLENRARKQRRNLYGPAPEGTYGRGISSSIMSYDEAHVDGELEMIRREIAAGRAGEHEREWLGYLMGIAGSGFRQGAFSYNQPRALIHHRILALELLSRIGSSETIPWLARFFRLEAEPLVKAAAARAIGGIGVDPNGMAIQEFFIAANTANPVYDEQILIAVAAATGALCRFSGPPLSDTGSRILIILSGINQRSSVQRQAFKELYDIKTVP